MKKIFFALSIFLFVCALASTASAAATIPATSVWVTPPSAAVGAALTLNALVYNSQTVDATVTVVFQDAATIATVSETIPAQSAKTVTADWTMPGKETVVTATVTTAVDKNKKPLTSLVGTLGTVTVSPGAAPAITIPTSFPGSATISAWFGPLLAKTEVFRTTNAVYFANLRDTTRLKLGITTVPTPVSTEPETPAPAPTTEGINGTGPQNQNLASRALGNPLDYGTLIIATSLATLFASQALFYIALALLVLLVLRFIVNLIF